MSGFIYLASPYSHPEMRVRVERFMAAQQAVIEAFRDKIAMFSPIVHWHHLACQYDLPFEYEYWQAQNDPMVLAAESLVVLGIDGWNTSRGVAHEIELAQYAGKPVTIWHMETRGERRIAELVKK